MVASCSTYSENTTTKWNIFFHCKPTEIYAMDLIVLRVFKFSRCKLHYMFSWVQYSIAPNAFTLHNAIRYAGYRID